MKPLYKPSKSRIQNLKGTQTFLENDSQHKHALDGLIDTIFAVCNLRMYLDED